MDGLKERLDSLGVVSGIGTVLTPLVNEQWLPLKPFMMTVVVTRRCNSRCEMCYIWQEQDSPYLSADEYRSLFDDDFSFVRQATLTGGEPTLRMDLPEIFDIIQAACPKLEIALLATSGLNTSLTVRHVKNMLDIAEAHPKLRKFIVQVSLDGVGEIHDEIRGIDGFFKKVESTLRQLQEVRSEHPILHLKISSVVMPKNLANMRELQALVADMGLPIHFSPVVIDTGYYNNVHQAALWFQPDENGANQEAIAFFEDLYETDKSSLRFYYRDIAGMLEGEERGRRCMQGFYGFIIEHDGEVYPCVNCETTSFGNLLESSFEEVWTGKHAEELRRRLRATCCPTCPSMCYPLPVNAFELANVVWVNRIKPNAVR